ncbi:MAG: hypothetical protein AAF412_13450 [Pseudomonadota bacterium]
MKDQDGNPIMQTSWKSQKTLGYEAKLEFVAKQLMKDAGAQETPEPVFVIPKPTGNSATAESEYYRTLQMQLMLQVGQSQLDHRAIAAIRGEPTSNEAYMFMQLEKTERHAAEMRGRNIDRWMNGVLGGLGLALQAYEINNPSAGGSGGTYVEGDVVVHQRQSNSGESSPGAAAGEGGAAGGSNGAQNRLAQNTVFGNNGGGIATDGSKLTATGYGSNQFLETSATGLSTSNSTVKGAVVADENNATSEFKDDDFSPSLDF